jgi:O-antigen ligase
LIPILKKNPRKHSRRHWRRGKDKPQRSESTETPGSESSRSRSSSESPDQKKHRRTSVKVWWLRATTGVAMGYVILSQVLMDLPGWSYLGFCFALLLAGMLGLGALYRWTEIKFEKWTWLPLAFVGYCLLRSFTVAKDTDPLNVSAQVLSTFLGALSIGLAMQSGVRFRSLIYAQVFSNLCVLAFIFAGVGPEPIPGEEDNFRYAGLTGNANELALQLTLGACLIWLFPKRSGLLPCCWAFAAVAAALGLTGSRKAVLIGLFFLILVLVHLVRTIIRRRSLILATAMVPVMVGIVLAVPVALKYGGDILAVRRSLEYQDSSYRKRALMIEQGLQLWRDNPLFGNGLDAFRGLSGEATYAHNNYAELLCDVGLVGMILFYALHAQVLVRASRARRWLMISCWLFILMLMATDVGAVSYNRKQTVMILMIITVSLAARKQEAPVRATQTSERTRVPDSVRPKPRRFVLRA